MRFNDFARGALPTALRAMARRLPVLAALFSIAQPAFAAIPQAERDALMNLYNATQGPHWYARAGWGGAAGTECGWSGVTCDAAQTGVVGLSLANNSLVGTVPALSPFTNLISVDMSQNSLSGAIPSLSGLTQLKLFNVQFNQFSGSMPALTGLSALQQVRLLGNQLSGALPSLSDTTSLVYFDASNNQFSGPIPAITQLAALEQFIVSTNQLSGAMPSLAGLSNLKKLDVSYNQLTGSVPSLGTNSSLQILYVDHNNLSGALPTPPNSLALATVCPNVQLNHLDSATWDVLTGTSPWYQYCGAGSKLVIADVNGGANPAIGSKFYVTVAVRDGNGASAVVATNISVQLSVAQGSGKLSYSYNNNYLSCTIPIGSSNCTVQNVSYSTVESPVRLAAASSGCCAATPPLSPGVSNAFSVVAGTYTVGGTVTGLAGPGLVLSLYPETQTATVDANGSFIFGVPLGDGSDYQVSVASAPNYPLQFCTVSNATGTILGGNVNTVQVACKRYFSLVVRGAPHGQVSPQLQTVLAGDHGSFAVYPSPGYRANFSADGCTVSGSGSLTTSALANDCTVTVNFVPLDYVPVGPIRVLDTRTGGTTSDGAYANSGALTASTPLALPILGRTGIPSTGVGALVLNVLATNTSAPGYITVWPSCAPRPNASNLNFEGQQTVANLVIVPTGCDLTTSVLSSTGPTDVVIDVVGYFSTGGSLNSLSPSRLLDTRPGTSTIDGGFAGGGSLASGQKLDLQVTGRAGIPVGAAAAALNVTATDTTAPAFITAWPTDQPRPVASNLNVVANQTIPNMVIAKVSASGQMSLFNSAGSTDLVVDAVAWFPPSSDLVPLVPARLIDTRPGYGTIDGTDAGQGPLLSGQSMYVDFLGRGGVPLQGVGALILNVTATNPTAAGFLSFNPTYVFPRVQNVNFTAGQTVPNLVIVPVSNNYYSLSIYTTVTTNVVVDVVGWIKGP